MRPTLRLDALVKRIEASRRVADWPLMVKFGIIPSLVVLLFAMVAVMELVALNSLRQNSDHIVKVDMRDAVRLAQIAATFERADAGLSRLLNMEAADAGNAELSLRIAETKAALAEVERDLLAFRQSPTGRVHQGRIDDALRDVQEYTQTAEVVTTMVGVNFESAAAMLDPFHRHARRITGNINAVTKSIIADSNARADVIGRRIGFTTWIFTLLALAALPVIAIATFLLGAAMVRSIRAIADATANLAAANYDIDIGRLTRKDELGSIVTALETFREQAIEARRVGEIEERSRKLQLAKVAAESASRAKSEFLANMSHELRTPLNAVLGYAQLLERDPQLDERQSNAARTIHQSGSHLLTLINDTLDLSKIEAGKFELCPAAFALTAFLEDLASIIRVRAEEKAVAFACEFDRRLPAMIIADEKRLRQILLNLLGNAVKFTDVGKVTLGAAVVSGTAGEVTVRFTVRDTGVGIREDQIRLIFEPFEQTGEMLRRVGGTGLGLNISRQLAELMGSRIEVASEVGAGSCFSFELCVPIANAPVVVSHSRGVVRGYHGERQSILVADDVAFNRQLLADLLGQRGFRIHEAANGKEAVEIAETELPDLILMDARMPVMDGLEATRLLRRPDSPSQVPIIMISAGASADERQESLAAGAADFLAKPVNEDDLLQAIVRILSIDWIYETDEPRRLAENDAVEIVVPPREQLQELHKLALSGNMRGIRNEAQRLADLDGRYRPLAQKLQRMAQSFQSQAVLELVEKYLEQGVDA